MAGDGSRFRPLVSRVDARQDAHGRQGCQVETEAWNIITGGDYHAPVQPSSVPGLAILPLSLRSTSQSRLLIIGQWRYRNIIAL